MVFELTILGSSSAIPIYQRNPAAQVLRHHEHLFLIDCGEATQTQLSRYKIKSHKINHIFISHLHGDHYLGLMGLLSTMHLQGRTTDLHLYAPIELNEILNIQFKFSETQLRFPLIFHPLKHDSCKIIFEDDHLFVETIKLNHRIPCMGFLFQEKKGLRNLIQNKIQQYQIPFTLFFDIKRGKDFITEKGKVINNSELTTEPSIPRSYAYCSDTLYDESIIQKIKEVDLLYHEATFLNELIDRANETYHTTALQAGIIAQKAKVKQLLIGHFSARYKDLHPLLTEAQSAFANTSLAIEGEKFIIG